MSQSKFVYAIFIRSTPEKLWDALTQSQYTKQYWCEVSMESDWKKGSSWKMLTPDGRLADSGEVLDIEKPKKLVLKWRHEIVPELKAEGYSQCTITLSPQADAIELKIIHEIDHADSKLIAGFGEGWPPLMSSLKSLLETGEPLPSLR